MGFNPNELKAARIKRGITQKALAKMLNCTDANYCMKENGVRRLFVSDANNIANALKLSPREINDIFFANNINSKGNFGKTRVATG
jgi:transcriptional regulator with XRE-family HTH domain